MTQGIANASDNCAWFERTYDHYARIAMAKARVRERVKDREFAPTYRKLVRDTLGNDNTDCFVQLMCERIAAHDQAVAN